MKVRLKQLFSLGAAALALTLTPFRSTDVAELVPVETLVLYIEDDQLVVDGGSVRGLGASWSQAWQDLKQGAPGEVFLGTADYVVLVGEAAMQLPAILGSELLRPAARVCLCPGEPPTVREANDYLTVQKGGTTLQQVHGAMLRQERVQLPVLLRTKGGLRLYGASHG